MSLSSSEPKMTLYEYIFTKIPMIQDPQVLRLLTQYSTQLKDFFSKTAGDKSGLKASIKSTLGELYTQINDISGPPENSNSLNKTKYRQIYNKLTEDWKRVYVSNGHVIKKTEGILPNLFIEVFIQIILEYYSNYIYNFNFVPNIISFKKVNYQKKNEYNVNEVHQYNMKMDKVYGFTLYDYINGTVEGQTFNPVFLFTVLQEVYQILQFFYHECGFVHGDLNPANVMISFGGASGQMKVQIIDFGYSLVNAPFLPDGRKHILSTFVDKPIENLRIITNRNRPNNYNTHTNNNLSQLDIKHLMILVISELMKKDMTNNNRQKIFKHQVGTLLKSHFDKFESQRQNIRSSNPSKRKAPNMNLVYNIVRSSFNPEFEINSFMTKMNELKEINIASTVRLNKTSQASPGKRGRTLFSNERPSGLPSFSLGNSNNEETNRHPSHITVRSRKYPAVSRRGLFGNNSNEE